MAYYFKIFSMLYMLVAAVVFAVLFYLDSHSTYCSISFINGVKCATPIATQVVTWLYMWMLVFTVVPAAIYFEVSRSVENISNPGIIMYLCLVVAVWLPLIAGVWFWIKTLFIKLASKIQ